MAGEIMQAQPREWSPADLDTIKRTVAKNASEPELKMFMALAGTYGLDPFAKDIWFIKMGSESPIIMTSRDGYLKIANRNPHFTGYEADVVYSGDTFRKTQGGVEHTYGLKGRGEPVGAYAVVYRDDRKTPVYFFAPMSDYKKDTQVWRKHPHAMILKVAEAMALKRAFSISGLVTQEELGEARMEAARPPEMATETIQAEFTEPEPEPTQHEPTMAEKKRTLYADFLKVCNDDKAQAQEVMTKVTEGRGSRDWTEEDLKHLAIELARRRGELATPQTQQAEPSPGPAPDSNSMDLPFGEVDGAPF